MKIENIKLEEKLPELLKLELLKTKSYRIKKNFSGLKLEDLELRLKKVLNVIHKYNLKNKRILFVGTPFKLPKNIKKILLKTKHIYIPSFVWVNGILTNPSMCFYSILKDKKSKKLKNSEFLFNLKKKVDLIVIFNEKNSTSPLQEGYLNHTPIISLNSSLLEKSNSTYKVYGDFNFTNIKIREKLLYLLIESTLKKKSLKDPTKHFKKWYYVLRRNLSISYN